MPPFFCGSSLPEAVLLLFSLCRKSIFVSRPSSTVISDEFSELTSSHTFIISSLTKLQQDGREFLRASVSCAPLNTLHFLSWSWKYALAEAYSSTISCVCVYSISVCWKVHLHFQIVFTHWNHTSAAAKWRRVRYRSVSAAAASASLPLQCESVLCVEKLPEPNLNETTHSPPLCKCI